jgi:hypothetical protein
MSAEDSTLVETFFLFGNGKVFAFYICVDVKQRPQYKPYPKDFCIYYKWNEHLNWNYGARNILELGALKEFASGYFRLWAYIKTKDDRLNKHVREFMLVADNFSKTSCGLRV